MNGHKGDRRERNAETKKNDEEKESGRERWRFEDKFIEWEWMIGNEEEEKNRQGEKTEIRGKGRRTGKDGEDGE